MSTNFYWKELPEWFKKNAKNPTENEDGIFIHIGKRSAAGGYCYTCGTTNHRYGTNEIHGKYNGNIEQVFGVSESVSSNEGEGRDWFHYKTCPCCGKEFSKTTSSFRWTLMIHKKLIQEIADCHQESLREKKIIVDEYDTEYTAKEFLDAVSSPIEFQDACIFS